MNTIRPYRSNEELKDDITEHNNNNKEYYKQYRFDNKESMREKKKEYCKKNKEKIAARKKEYYNKNKERIAARNSLKKYHISKSQQKNDANVFKNNITFI